MINTYGEGFVHVYGDRLELNGSISQASRNWLSATEEFSDLQIRAGLGYLYEIHTADTPIVSPEKFRGIVVSLIDRDVKGASKKDRSKRNRVDVLVESKEQIKKYELSLADNDRRFYIASAFIATTLVSSALLISWAYLSVDGG